jgi:hypothetical protein
MAVSVMGYEIFTDIAVNAPLTDISLCFVSFCEATSGPPLMIPAALPVDQVHQLMQSGASHLRW